jgi:hypothetical protein
MTTLDTDSRVERLNTLRGLRLQVRNRRLARWEHNPVAWTTDALPNITLAGYQQQQLQTLAKTGHVAARATRGAGKTMPLAVAALWFVTTRELMGVDWKAPITAGSWAQLAKFTMPEIHRWTRDLQWDVLGLDEWRRNRELVTLGIKGRYGELFAINSDDPNLIEGAHAEHLFLGVDEAKAVPDLSWESMQGYFSSPGTYYRYVISKPGAPAGWFYDIHTGRPGYAGRWDTFHVNATQAVAEGRIAQEWVDTMADLWGRQSTAYRTHVDAEFAGDTDGVIPLEWIEAAMARHNPDTVTDCHPEIVSIDVADEGPDRSVIGLRCRNWLYQIDVFEDGDPEDTADRAHHRAATGSSIIVDSIGVGAGTLARLKRLQTEGKYTVRAFIASKGTKRKDATGHFGFANTRSAAWWNLRELLNPKNEADDITLPPSDELLGELSAPTWREVAGGRIQVESKDDIRKRIGRSTDLADVAVQAFWIQPGLAHGVAAAVDDAELTAVPWLNNL